MNKLFTIFILGMFMFSFASAITCHDTVQQNTNIELIQKCPTCSYVNVTTIDYPNGTVFLNDAMTIKSNGVDYNYSLPDSSQLGIITYTTIGDKDGSLHMEDLCIEITTNGSQTNIQTVLATILLLIFFCSLILGIAVLRDKIDFEKWYDNIRKKDRTYIQSSIAVIPYTFMRNIYLIYYLLAFPIIFLVTDLIIIYNITSIAYMFNIFSKIYTVGMVIPGLVFLGEMIKILVDMWENFQKKNWGLDE